MDELGASAFNGWLRSIGGRGGWTGRVLIVAAHPDDEIIGVGGHLGELSDVRVAHVTDGSPLDLRDAQRCGFTSREQYAEARRAEVLRALCAAGVHLPVLHPLGLVDQTAAHNLVQLTESLTQVFAAISPGVVITHAYESGHPDHDAAAFAVHTAAARLRERGGPATDPPTLVEMTSYHANPDNPNELAAGEFLPAPHRSPTATKTFALSAMQWERKRRALACFESQKAVLDSLGIEQRMDESFRIAPAYDFSLPPHDGPLWYEQFGWGITGRQFCALALQAQAAMNGVRG